MISQKPFLPYCKFQYKLFKIILNLLQVPYILYKYCNVSVITVISCDQCICSILILRLLNASVAGFL